MYWIIEPHSDDAYLSLHEHMSILWKDKPKTIVTVFCDEKRAKEAKKYADVIGADHKALMFEESGGLGKQGGNCGTWRQWGITLNLGDVIFFPVGLQHPDHLAVNRRIPTVQNSVCRYIDTPYYAKQKIGEHLREAVFEKKVVSMHYCSARKWKHIPIFASQGKYFFHHPPQDLPRLEMVLR